MLKHWELAHMMNVNDDFLRAATHQSMLTLAHTCIRGCMRTHGCTHGCTHQLIHTNPYTDFTHWTGIGYSGSYQAKPKHVFMWKFRHVVQPVLNRHCPWVLKDPRLCFTGDLVLRYGSRSTTFVHGACTYNALYAHRDLQSPVCVLVWRHPAHVIQSLNHFSEKSGDVGMDAPRYVFAKHVGVQPINLPTPGAALNNHRWTQLVYDMWMSAIRTCRGYPTVLLPSDLTTPATVDAFLHMALVQLEKARAVHAQARMQGAQHSKHQGSSHKESKDILDKSNDGDEGQENGNDDVYMETAQDQQLRQALFMGSDDPPQQQGRGDYDGDGPPAAQDGTRRAAARLRRRRRMFSSTSKTMGPSNWLQSSRVRKQANSVRSRTRSAEAPAALSEANPLGLNPREWDDDGLSVVPHASAWRPKMPSFGVMWRHYLRYHGESAHSKNMTKRDKAVVDNCRMGATFVPMQLSGDSEAAWQGAGVNSTIQWNTTVPLLHLLNAARDGMDIHGGRDIHRGRDVHDAVAATWPSNCALEPMVDLQLLVVALETVLQELVHPNRAPVDTTRIASHILTLHAELRERWEQERGF